MNRLQYLFTKLAEEAAEVSQIALKAAQFGPDEVYAEGDGRTNAGRVHGELHDLMAVVELLNDEFNFEYYPDYHAREAKKKKIAVWAEHAVQLGMVRP